jgi:orotate phosphoribosyltransferase
MPLLSTTESGNLSGFSGDVQELVEHLRDHALRTDGPFTLRSGRVSSWYLDARQTTYDGAGALLVGAAVTKVLDPTVAAIGGMTMGADPIAVAAALVATQSGRHLRSFSVRKATKEHGLGGRLVGPVGPGDVVAAVDDTVTTGGALFDSIDAMIEHGLSVAQVICLVDRSDGRVAAECRRRGLPYTALVTPAALGVGEQ